jgi:hypothetical protein
MLLNYQKSLPDLIDLKKHYKASRCGYGVSITEGATKEVIDTLKQITIKSFNQYDNRLIAMAATQS